jgi:hypothetical protein
MTNTASLRRLSTLKRLFAERRRNAKARRYRRECLTLHRDGLLTQELADAYIAELSAIPPDQVK